MKKENDIELRQLSPTDYEELAEVFDLCYGELDTFWSESQVEKLTHIFPQGQIVAEIDGKVVGCALSLITSWAKAASCTYKAAVGNGTFNTHSPYGEVLYCLEIFVHPDYRGCHIARKMYEYRKELCRQMNLECIILGGRMPNYHLYSHSFSAEEYACEVRDGGLYDPVLTCQTNNGFELCGIRHNYFEFDTESAHNAALLKWKNESFCKKPTVAVLGAGNVGMAIAADLSVRGYKVTLIKTSNYNDAAFTRLRNNHNRLWLKENGVYKQTAVYRATRNVTYVKSADIIFCAIQSGYYKELVERLDGLLKRQQILIDICSYGSAFYFQSECYPCPIITETIEPYLEGRIELNDKEGEVVFRVGCRQQECPASIVPAESGAMIKKIFAGYSHKLTVLETALLNPNMVLHTVGSLMSLSRIEYSKGDFCMYREAYARSNEATLRVMLELDKEKQKVLRMLGFPSPSVFEIAGFKKDEPLESFYRYSESSDRAVSPTSVNSRYITEDVPQGLVLLESVARRVGIVLPVATALINLANAALGTDFRAKGRTVDTLNIGDYIDALYEREQRH